MNSSISSFIINSENLSDILDNKKIYLPINTIKSYISPKAKKELILYDYNTHKNLLTIKSDNDIISCNKLLNNSNYYLISLTEKILLLLIKDNGKSFEKVENSLSKCLEGNIQKIIFLDNQNAITITNNKLISYYMYNNSNYKRFFKNLNKGGYIYGLIKLPQNKFCFLSVFDEESLLFVEFNEDFTHKEKIIKIERPIDNIKNNIIFKIKSRQDKIIIIGKSEFYIYDINFLEIQTIYSPGLICGVLPFNKGKNENEEIYEYFALIIRENENFYLVIYYIQNFIMESEKFNLSEYCPQFEQLFISNDISKVYDEIVNVWDYSDKKQDIYDKIVLFDMHYDIKDNGDIFLVIDFISSWIKNKLTILLDINLNNLKFK